MPAHPIISFSALLPSSWNQVGQSYFLCIPRVQLCLWMNELIHEKMNEENPDTYIWCLTNNGSAHTVKMEVPWSSRFSWGGGDRLPWERVSPALLTHPAQTLMPWPGDIWVAQGTSKGQVSICLRILHRISSIIAPCSQAVPRSHLPVLSVTAASPLCA